MENKLIAHSLIMFKNKYLVIKRSDIKRGEKNYYPSYWDIPGGSVEDGELPRQAAIRECQEEVGLVISLENIIHEDSNIDNNKIFTRLVYSANLLQNENINITKLESRPIKQREFKSIFYLDFEGHIDDEKVQNAFELAKESGAEITWLGSYLNGDE